MAEAGVNADEDLVGKCLVVERRVNLQIKRPYEVTNLSDEWNKLSRQTSCKTRTISIDSSTLWELQVNPTKELVGKWKVQDGGLFLDVQYRSQITRHPLR